MVSALNPPALVESEIILLGFFDPLIELVELQLVVVLKQIRVVFSIFEISMSR